MYVKAQVSITGGPYETPQTAIATTIALPTDTEGFEVTPVVERAVELFFMFMCYYTYYCCVIAYRWHFICS